MSDLRKSLQPVLPFNSHHLAATPSPQKSAQYFLPSWQIFAANYKSVRADVWSEVPDYSGFACRHSTSFAQFFQPRQMRVLLALVRM